MKLSIFDFLIGCVSLKKKVPKIEFSDELKQQLRKLQNKKNKKRCCYDENKVPEIFKKTD